MKLPRRQLRDTLEGMGSRPPALPGRDYEARALRRLLHTTHEPVSESMSESIVEEDVSGGRRSRVLVGATIAACAAAVIIAVVVVPTEKPAQVVPAGPGATQAAPATTLMAPSTTAKPPPVTSPPTTRPPEPTTTSTAPATAVEEPAVDEEASPPAAPSTTKAPASDPAPVRLGCQSSGGKTPGKPSVSCKWNAAAGVTVAGWRLYRGPGGAAVFTTTEPSVTTYTDRDVVFGSSYGYTVEAVGPGGEPVGRSSVVSVACCGA